jgi:hypothetical protein
MTTTSFAQTLSNSSAAHSRQPEKPTHGALCHSGDAVVSVGWKWTGAAWRPACGAHIQGHHSIQIFNTEFEEDW